MKKRYLLAALAAIPLLSTAAEPPATGNKQAERTVTTPQISQDKLDRIRKSLTAQIAAYESSEQAMRAPTADETAALALPTSGAAQAVTPLAGGGVALRADTSQASLAIATRDDGGKVTIGHDVKAKTANGARKAHKGDAHAH